MGQVMAELISPEESERCMQAMRDEALLVPQPAFPTGHTTL
jgi:hypothetical protein